MTASPASPPTDQEDSGLDELTLGLHALDLSTSTLSAGSSPTSVAVGGARPKVKPSSQTDSFSAATDNGVEDVDVKAESVPFQQEKQVNSSVGSLSAIQKCFIT